MTTVSACSPLPTHLPLQPSELLVEAAQPAPAGGVEGVEEVRDPLDGSAHLQEVQGVGSREQGATSGTPGGYYTM